MLSRMLDGSAVIDVLALLTMSFGLGTAIGPLAAGVLVRFGFIAPFVFGATLALVGLVLVYTQVQDPQGLLIRTGSTPSPRSPPARIDHGLGPDSPREGRSPVGGSWDG